MLPARGPEAETALFAPGVVVGGQYRLLRRVHVGLMSTVFEAETIPTGERRAVKLLSMGLADDTDARARLDTEAAAARGVDDPNVVRVLDGGTDVPTGLPFLVMEWLEGTDLGARLRDRGPFPLTEVLALLDPIAQSLDRVHATGAVHRDVKPENLFLCSATGTLKLLDFGAAKWIDGSSRPVTTRALGTPLYMAPEQVHGDGLIDGRADLYALAQVVFTLLVGEPYFSRQGRRGAFPTLTAVAAGIRDPASVRARAHGVTLPPGFDGWFARAAAADPAERFDTAVGMLAELRSVAAGGSTARHGRSPRARLMVFGAVAAAVIGVVVALRAGGRGAGGSEAGATVGGTHTAGGANTATPVAAVKDAPVAPAGSSESVAARAAPNSATAGVPAPVPVPSSERSGAAGTARAPGTRRTVTARAPLVKRGAERVEADPTEFR